jgi:hypothetical protein
MNRDLFLPQPKADDFGKDKLEPLPDLSKSAAQSATLGTEPSERTDPKAEDRYSFFKQASASHPIPTTELICFQYLETDPTVFATISRASKFFDPDVHDGELQLREMMCLADYKNLTVIRDYIYFLRILTEVDKSEEMRVAVKKKLMQI